MLCGHHTQYTDSL